MTHYCEIRIASFVILSKFEVVLTDTETFFSPYKPIISSLIAYILNTSEIKFCNVFQDHGSMWLMSNV